MIYNVSVLSGYTALIGTCMVHLPMLVAMLIHVRKPGLKPSDTVDFVDMFDFPDELVDDLNIVTPEAERWYWIGAAIHLIMSALQLAMFNIDKFGKTYMASAIQLSAFIQIFNFTLVAQMWVLTDRNEKLTESQ